MLAKNCFRRIVLVFLLVHLSSCSLLVVRQQSEKTGIIDADNPDIRYVGRFDFSNPKEVKYDWAGVAIHATFQGTSCSVRITDSTDEYAVIIDHRAPRILTTDTATVYRVATGLADSIPHTLILQKRTEPVVGRGAFKGLILDRGCGLLPPEPRPERRIEFIGNSITSGYGDECDTLEPGFRSFQENACMSFASMTARALDADYSLVSYSGRGVVRNYGDANTTSTDPMPELYDRTCFYDSTLKWNFSRWTPQVVVINLGTNDFSTEPYPDKTVFQDAYRNLINRVRSIYTGVTVFCICGPMIGEPCFSYIEEVVNDEQKGKREKDVFFIGIDESSLTDAEWGCDHHPNIHGMQRMTGVIVPEIRLRMSW